MDLSEARGLVLFRVVRGGIGISRRLGAIGTVPSTGHCHTHPRTRASQRTDWPPPEKITGDGRALHPRRSSGLRFQFFCVEVFSLLPKRQRNGCDLARQCKPRHGRLYAFGQRSLVEILERPGRTLAIVAAPLNKPFRSWLWSLFKPRMQSSFFERRT
jgi:hypothetical protein